jgi:ABC-2 type transport system permease protein
MSALTNMRLVATREFTERGRSRTFLLSNLFILVVIIAAVVVPVLLSGGADEHRLGVVGDEAAAVAAAAVGGQGAFDVVLEVVPVADRAAAERALVDGTLDSVLVDARVLLVDAPVPGAVRTLLSQASGATVLGLTLAEAGVAPEAVAGLLVPLAIERVERPDGEGGGIDFESPTFLLAFLAAFTLYGLLALLGQWVAQGIVEEKQSRVVEVLLSAVRPGELLVGKVVGLGALGLAQLAVLAGAGIGATAVLSGVDLPPGGLRVIAVVLAWFVPGYLLYAMLFALTASTVSRVEDLQSASLIPIAVLVGALLAAQAVLADPTSTLAGVVTYVPFTAPIVQPALVAAGAVGWGGTLVSLAIALATLGVLVPLTARVYRGGVLRTAKVSLREALRAGRNGRNGR